MSITIQALDQTQYLAAIVDNCTLVPTGVKTATEQLAGGLTGLVRWIAGIVASVAIVVLLLAGVSKRVRVIVIPVLAIILVVAIFGPGLILFFGNLIGPTC